MFKIVTHILIGTTMIIKNEIDLIFPYTYDSSNMMGSAEKVLLPENVKELEEFFKENYLANQILTIAGAGTGITGSRVPNGGTVLSTELLKGIVELEDDYVSVLPATTLAELNYELNRANKLFPVNPTEINASVGGNVATNASGARTFKYGAYRNWVIGLDVILPDGDKISIERGQYLAVGDKFEFITNSGRKIKFDIPDLPMPNIKNASGFYLKKNMDLLDLFIGSEGTLGLFSKIKLKLLNKPANLLGGIIYFDDNSKLLEFTKLIRNISINNNKIPIESVNDISSRLIEYFDVNSLNLLRPKYPQIPYNAIGAIWFEQEYHLENEDSILDKWYAIIQNYSKLADSTWIALNDNEHENLREFRHELPLQVYENLTNNSQKKVGLDTAVPADKFDILFNYYSNEFDAIQLQKVVFGHIGNSHLHANIFCKDDDEYAQALNIYDKVIDLSLSLGGTISAEHGIGKLKKKYLIKMYGKKLVDEMKNIKLKFDPKNLLNNGTIFD